MKTAIAGVAVALLSSACVMGPDYARPAQTVPGQYRDQVAQGEASLGDADWRSVYPDPVLQGLIESALAANTDLRIAMTRVEQARAQLGVARLQQLPGINGSGSVTRGQQAEDVRAPGAPRIGEQASASVGLSWELDFWGRLRRLSEAGRAEWLASEQGARAARVSLIGDVAAAYYGLCALDGRSAAAQRSVGTRESFLKLTQAQLQRGVVSGLDVASAEAQYAAAQVSVHDLARQIAQTENALSVLLARTPQSLPRGECAAPVSSAPPGLPSRLLERRPDVLQAEQGLVAANARVGAAKAALFPTLSLTGTFGVLSTDVSELFTAGAEQWSVGVGLLQPLLNADRNGYQIDLASARKREALLRYEAAVRNAFREVADALVAQSRNAEVLRAQQSQVDALSRAEQIAQARYKSGYSSYFDVINADRDLFGAEQALFQARLAAQLATVELYRALGGGWEVSSASSPAAVTPPPAPVANPETNPAVTGAP